MNTMRLTWLKGGEAQILSLDGDRISLRSTIPSAPGSRPEGTLEGGGALKVKVARCRSDAPEYILDGRLIDTTRDVRLAILAALAPPRGDASS